MCSSPKIPAPPPAPQPQQMPDTIAAARKAREAAGATQSTVLTGSQGIASSSLNVGGTTLLGG